MASPTTPRHNASEVCKGKGSLSTTTTSGGGIGSSSCVSDSRSRSSALSSNNLTGSSSSVPLILDGTFFAIKSQHGDKVVAVCQKCVPGKTFSGTLGATSNFLLHLKRSHSNLLGEYERHKQTALNAREAKRKATPTGARTSAGHASKQPTLDCLKVNQVAQSTVDNLVMNYIVTGMLPLRTVETEGFRNLVTGLAHEATVMSRVTLTRKLHTRQQKMIFDLKEHMSAVTYICTTADAWSTCGRGYLGVTAHWIDDRTLKRHSAALACRRLTGSHTFDVLAEALSDIYQEYALMTNTVTSKIVGCVTDNGSNFLKAFREFGLESADASEQGDDGDSSTDDPDDSVDAELSFANVHDLLDADSSSCNIILPPHHPCSSHTLSLIAVADVQGALQENASYKRLYHSTMAKCSALWNCSSRSLKCQEAIESIIHRRLVKPCPTRWNSLYDSLYVLKTLRANLKSVCQAVGVAVFRDVELDFIDEYVDVMSPIALALDRLQGQKSESMAFIGALIPTLMTVKHKLTGFTQSPNLRHCLPMATAMLAGLEKRFGHLLNLEPAAKDYIIGAVSHPYFKLRWVPPEHVEQCRLLFTRVRIIQPSDSNTNANQSSASSASAENDKTSDDEYFAFLTSSSTSTPGSEDTTTNKIQLEYAHYLEDPDTDLSMLNKYPNVKIVFMKFNTLIPSSGPVERLFSFGGLIHSAKRNRLSDKSFEMLLLLKANATVFK